MTTHRHPPAIDHFMKIKDARKIVCLTAYTAPMAAALDRYCDLLLVGDSLAMAVYGMETTRGVDLDIMIRHGAAVTRRAQNALVIVDLPAGSYEANPATAIAAARRVIDETGAHGVKLEGGVQMAPHIAAIIATGIPVMAHIGLLPQQAETIEDFKITGRTPAEAMELQRDLDAVIAAGAFAVVFEGIIEPVAHDLAKASTIPTIGIGASASCDGQILVSDDMLGMFDSYVPKFVHKFADLQTMIGTAATAYRDAVIGGTFPTESNLYNANRAAKHTTKRTAE